MEKCPYRVNNNGNTNCTYITGSLGIESVAIPCNLKDHVCYSAAYNPRLPITEETARTLSNCGCPFARERGHEISFALQNGNHRSR